MIFRYPGGKHRLIPLLAPFLTKMVKDATEFHDVCVGGGSILLHLATQYPDIQLYANDLDSDIAAFWQTVVTGNVQELGERLLHTRVTVDYFYELRQQRPANKLDQAFNAIFFNRCGFSGLKHGNPIGGWSQFSSNKVFSRFNAKQIVQEIQAAHQLLAGRTSVSCIHAADYLSFYPHAPKYLDPPYFEKGDVLYPVKMSYVDHLRLAQELSHAQNWLLSYDFCPVVADLYSWANRFVIPTRYCVNGFKTEWKEKKELLITARS